MSINWRASCVLLSFSALFLVFLQVVPAHAATEKTRLRVDDYQAYYRAAKARFEAAVLDEGGGLLPIGPSTTPGGRVRYCIPRCDR